MKRLAYVLAAGLLAVALVTVIARAAITTEAVRHAAIRHIEALTGLETEVHGETRLSLFPRLGFRIGDVELERSAGRRKNVVAEVEAVRGEIALLPLLTGHVILDELTLVRPQVVIGTEAGGAPDWVPDGGALGDLWAGRQPAPDREGTRIGAIRIEDGAIEHVDERTGRTVRLTAVNGSIVWPALNAPFKMAASLIWNGEIVSVALEAATPLDYLTGGSTRVRLALESGLLRAGLDGRAGTGTEADFDGSVALSSSSVRAALRWLGHAGAGLPVPAELSATAKLRLVGRAASLSELALTLDGSVAEGGMRLQLGDDGRPDVQGTLAFDVLDLDRFRPPARPDSAPGTPGWLDQPITIADLDQVSADMRISARTVHLGAIEFGELAGTVSVRSGAINIGIGDVALFAGRGLGSLTLAPAPEGISFRLSAKLERTEMSRLLGQTLGIRRIDGIGNLTATLSGAGATPSQIVSTLSGEGRIAITGGALAGVDVASLAETLRTGRVEGWPANPAASTRFDTLAATFRVAQGTASTANFSLIGPGLDVSAEAEVRLLPASIAGHGLAELGGADSEQGLTVPFVIEGPVGRPSIYPDPLWLLERAAVSEELLRDFKRDLEQKPPELVVQEILGHALDRGPAPRLRQPVVNAPQQ
ncbi:uncharacterized protein involved in outer membrane biogenesis [Tepidamorphus gemmatus]|uniref:Uncharacterized protein involved in outer membrane biogenesis n=1 Tax=Tepidamorphus gemmatus TaxID=747076 RepID=A0A4V2UZP7_9HYPH|nr:AsmA family protein [Tepidamorphus gemmatus]TCT12068.1 uncharacterized protein involved in outer membrane biogenesis [Tepidamorphus gemmatus]